jgi:predicted dehydrogenase
VTPGASRADASAPLRVGVVGTGAHGRQHARILSRLAGVHLVGVVDRQHEVAEAVAAEYGTTVFEHVDALAAAVDAAVVAVPTVAHGELGAQLLRRGIHVLVEKPMASSLAEAEELLQAAQNRILAVGHVEFFNPAVQALFTCLSGESPRYLEVERLSVFSPRSLDVDVVLDLMIHDLQILQVLDPSGVREVRAVGVAVLSPRVDIANARVELASGCVANLTASRVSPERSRRLRGFFSSRYYSLDYREQTLKGVGLEAVDDRSSSLDRRITSREVAVESAEPLACELRAFVDRCRGGEAPLVDGEAGKQALGLALQVAADIAERGLRAGSVDEAGRARR